MKACIDCKWYALRDGYWSAHAPTMTDKGHACSFGDMIVDAVTGVAHENPLATWDCYQLRSITGACGPDAKNFEAKP